MVDVYFYTPSSHFIFNHNILNLIFTILLIQITLIIIHWGEDVHAEFGLYEALVEGMRSSNAMLIEWCGVLEFFVVVSFTHVVFFLTCKLACKIWIVYYPIYIALTNGSSFFWEKKKRGLHHPSPNRWLMSQYYWSLWRGLP